MKLEPREVKEMIEGIKTGMREVLADDELIDLAAKCMRKAYGGLMDNGFSPDQAIMIVAHQGLGVRLS